MIGVDIIEIERVAAVLKRRGAAFLKRVFTKNEREQIKDRSAATIAGRFAAKEAISKALGTGIGSALSFQDIEILTSLSGKPVAKCKGQPIDISISHNKTSAIAVAYKNENGSV